jgi:hypothetical protein
MRLYVPAVPSTLAGLAATGGLPGPVRAFAVTPELTAWVSAAEPVEDDEELEFVALAEAARGSLRLLAAAPTEAPSRVVIAADVPAADVEVLDTAPDSWPGSVVVPAGLPLTAVVSVHVDDPGAASVVRAACQRVVAADADDISAEDVVERCADLALLWYTPAELSTLLPPA